jgi:hypothetical protein
VSEKVGGLGDWSVYQRVLCVARIVKMLALLLRKLFVVSQCLSGKLRQSFTALSPAAAFPPLYGKGHLLQQNAYTSHTAGTRL